MVETRRKTLSNLFIVGVVMLLLLPFLTSIQDLLTRAIIRLNLYNFLQDLVVPYELSVLAAILKLLGLTTRAGNAYIQFVREGRVEVVYLAWNCIGWQSLVFLVVSLIGGLSGKFTVASRLQTVVIGFLGTFLINMLRLVLVVVVYYFSDQKVGLVFHNYFSSLLAILWLFGFWWIAYSFVLEEKGSRMSEREPDKGVIKADLAD